jgi:GNAT-family acetyltransferase (TIGR03103 family)
MTSHEPRHRLRFDRINSPSLRNWGDRPSDPEHAGAAAEAVLECGWGRLIFAHTFDDPRRVAQALLRERAGERDIALYLRDPQVVLAHAPQELFLDPSHTFRLWLNEYRAPKDAPRGYNIRRLRTHEQAHAVNRIYAQRSMAPLDPDFVWHERASHTLTYLVAEDLEGGDIIGTATGVDHHNAFDDPENGSSLWCLAVDARTAHTGVGLALVNHLAGHFQARGRAFLDLSVIHDNEAAIALYEQIGFRRVPVFCIKHKNPVNEPLFMGPDPGGSLNPYATIIVDEARRRGIAVEIIDAQAGYFALTYGGRSVVCRESLSELTSAIAMSRCDDKQVTRRVLANVGLQVPEQRTAHGDDADKAFMHEHGAVVVKPVRGEQGRGISVNVYDELALEQAIDAARREHPEVLIERFHPGQDLRVIVIGDEVVAAAIRRPPQVSGDGRRSITELIERQSRRRQDATGGESRIPLDAETRRCVREAGHDMDTVLPEGEHLVVRKAANLHTGGTIHDVTDAISTRVHDAARRAARALAIPLVGLDFIVPAPDSEEYVIIEANERPGLANHEPQPTAQRFIDLLFPMSIPRRPEPDTAQEEGQTC